MQWLQNFLPASLPGGSVVSFWRWNTYSAPLWSSPASEEWTRIKTKCEQPEFMNSFLFKGFLMDTMAGLVSSLPFLNIFKTLYIFLWKNPFTWNLWCHIWEKEAYERRQRMISTFPGRELVIHLHTDVRLLPFRLKGPFSSPCKCQTHDISIRREEQPGPQHLLRCQTCTKGNLLVTHASAHATSPHASFDI